MTYYVSGSSFDNRELRFTVSQGRTFDDNSALSVADGSCSYRISGEVNGSTITGTYDTLVVPRHGTEPCGSHDEWVRAHKRAADNELHLTKPRCLETAAFAGELGVRRAQRESGKNLRIVSELRRPSR